MKNNWHFSLLISLFLLAAVWSDKVGHSQPAQRSAAPTQSHRLMPTDYQGSDRFGSAVAIDGNTVVVGAYYQNNFRGSVYIYTRTNGVWSETKKLIASDGTGSDQFGSVVAIHGDTIVVSAPYADVRGYSWHGAVYIFERNAGGPDNWGEVKKLEDRFGDIEAEWFGYALAIQDNLIAVGSPNDEGDGAVVLFGRNEGGENNWGEVKRVTIDDGTLYTSDFGSSVFLYGDLLVAGNTGHAFDDNHLFQGSAYIFERNAGGENNWGEVKMLFDPQGTPNDQFGTAVSADENLVIVSAKFADVGSNVAQGAVYLYGRDSGGENNWGVMEKITAADGEEDDYFGNALSLSGDLLLIGADGDDILYENQGAVYLYDRNEGGPNNWGMMKKLAPNDGRENDYFGVAVALTGETALIGASGVDLPDIFEYNIGAVYITGVLDHTIYLPHLRK